MQRLKDIARGVTLACVLVGVALFASPASAWELSKSTNGVVLSREWSEDSTATAYVTVYYDYKGGGYWTSSFSPFSGANYNASLPQISMSGSANSDSLEIDLKEGYRCQLIALTAGSQARNFAVLNEPQEVSVLGTSTVQVAGSVLVTGVPECAPASVAITGTIPVSIEGTPLVDVSQFGPLGAVELSFIGLLGSGALGFAVYRGLATAIGGRHV